MAASSTASATARSPADGATADIAPVAHSFPAPGTCPGVSRAALRAAWL